MTVVSLERTLPESTTASGGTEQKKVVAFKYSRPDASPRFKLVAVTPVMAQKWLDRMDKSKQRRLDMAMVKLYADDMREGRWTLTHQAIAFDSSDHCIDGQHRLSAVVESGATVYFMVATGCDRQCGTVNVDTGKVRGMGVQLQINRGIDSKQAAFESATLRELSRIESAAWSARRTSYGKTNGTRERYAEGLKWAYSVFGALPRKNPRRGSPYVAALVYAYATSPNKVKQFASAFINKRQGASDTDPPVLLSDWCESRSLSNEANRYNATKVAVWAVEAYVSGRDVAGIPCGRTLHSSGHASASGARRRIAALLRTTPRIRKVASAA